MVAAVAEPIGSTKLQKQILGDSPSKEEILRRAKEDKIEFVDLQFTDVMGIVKSVTIRCRFWSTSSTAGSGSTARRSPASPGSPSRDMFLMPDLSTYAVIPWTEGEHTHRPGDLLGPQPERRSAFPAIPAASSCAS